MNEYLKDFPSVAMVILLLYLPVTSLAEVEGNCIMCHKMPGLGIYDKSESAQIKGDKLIYYINDRLFDASYHGKLRCKSCHTEVDKYPHTGVPKVDCATDCHIRDPSVNKSFSHKKIVNDFNESIHGEEGTRGLDKNDLPVCKDCHNNKPYHIALYNKVEVEDSVRICHECHQEEAWAGRFFEHMLYRSQKRRASRDIIKLCSRCHMDKEIMDRHELDIVVGFKETFHAKAISYGNEDVANCLNCHAPRQMGFSPHRIKSARDESSSVHHDKKFELCSQAGCHEKAKSSFAAGGRVHPSPGTVQIVGRATAVTIDGISKEDEKKLLADTIFEAKVIGWIELFYKVLIAVVIGGFIVHQSMTIYATRREKRSGGHNNERH